MTQDLKPFAAFSGRRKKVYCTNGRVVTVGFPYAIQHDVVKRIWGHIDYYISSSFLLVPNVDDDESSEQYVIIDILFVEGESRRQIHTQEEDRVNITSVDVGEEETDVCGNLPYLKYEENFRVQNK